MQPELNTQTCKKCLLNKKYPKIVFDNEGVCSLCNEKREFKPFGEQKLVELFDKYRNKHSEFDALVPLSGGKDSTYILHLAVNVYKLRVVAMTYDNGLLSELAVENIKNAVAKTGVKHLFCKPDINLQKKIYKNMFLQTGDICGACDIATKAHILKTARRYKVPMILYGSSPLEEDSFLPDSIQDIARFKYILKKTKELSKNEIDKYLIYPNLNLFKLSIWKKTGVIGKEIRPLFYIKNPTDKEIAEIIKKEFNWKDKDNVEYSRHLDCIAEPFTNYVRNKIYGYERRICQYSNMIRKGEISKQKAEELYKKDNIDSLPDNYKEVLDFLDISEKEMKQALNYKPLQYEKHISTVNRIFAKIIKVKKACSR